MRATDIFREEHDLIGTVLDALLHHGFSRDGGPAAHHKYRALAEKPGRGAG
jgi:hypothetical protein